MFIRVARVMLFSLMIAAIIGVGVAQAKPRKQPTSAGYDVSYPQCGAALPANPVFGVVGVNGGRAYATNSCLSTEYQWALRSSSTTYAKASFYANTADPSPTVSTHWPTGQTSPRPCDGGWNVDCTYDYGWNAAQDSFNKAAGVAGPAGARAGKWWLDVEIGNSWAGASDTPNWAQLNISDLQGAVAFLQSQGVTSVGFYSTQYQWNQITGLNAASSSAYFSSTLPNWIAGASSLDQATSRCSSASSLTGGRVELTQYPASGFDGDYVCP